MATPIHDKPSRIRLKSEHAFTHYFPTIFFIIPAVYFIFDLIRRQFEESEPVSPDEEMLITVLAFLAAGGLFYYRQRRLLNFKAFLVPHTQAQFQDALERTIAELDWKIEKNKKGYLKAYRHGSLVFLRRGEMITIINDHDNVLINSISDPDLPPTPFSFGRNRENVIVFVRNLVAAVEAAPSSSSESEDTRQFI